ncbi:MAG: VanZ family protein [Thermoleophilia bacterium]
MGVCVVVASVDEWHQSMVASRTGSLVDVGVDSVGAAVASIWFHVRGRPGPVKDSRVERG